MKTFRNKRIYLLLKLLVLLSLGACECALADPVWKGNFDISSPADIQALAGYEEVTGCLTIGGSPQNAGTLKTLKGLESLVRVGELHIEYTNSLATLEGLNGLTEVLGDVYISGNTALTTMEALENLNKIKETIHISDNPALKSLAGLNKITEAENLIISGNDSLTNLHGVNALKNVRGIVAVSSNPSLITLEGLDQLASAESINIQENKNLMALPEFPNLKSVPDYLIIMQNEALAHTEGFNYLASAGETVISGNKSLSRVDGFENMVETDVLCIERNNTLSGISFNPQLSVKKILEIKKNPELSTDLAMLVKSQIVRNGGTPGTITINQNGYGAGH